MRKVVVVGLGSMGRRRIRLLRSLPEPVDVVGVDLSLERLEQVRQSFGVSVEKSLADALVRFRPDAAFVCTSPASHGPIVMQCLGAGLNVFTEINLMSDWYEQAEALAMERGVTLFISSTFLYRKEIEFVCERVRNDTVNYIYHSGQYLPDWHPWENYKDFFVSDRRTNACREILSIEFPWIVRAFGEIEALHVMRGKNSRLDIDFPDNYIITLRHANGNKGVFCQDVISRKGLRRLEIYSENQHIFWEGTPQTLSVYDITSKSLTPVTLYETVEQQAGYNANVIENAYREELINFFDCMDGMAVPRHTLAEDGKLLKLVSDIERGVYG